MRLIVDVYLRGSASVPKHLAMYNGNDLIQEVGPADMKRGSFLSRPFTLKGGVRTCVLHKESNANIFAYLRFAVNLHIT